jgi:hypothetical protein
LTLLIVILDYFGFGKQFWKINDPALKYSVSQEVKEDTFKSIENAIDGMSITDDLKKLAKGGEKELRFISYHIEENTRYALNELKPEERYYSNFLEVLFYTSHTFSFKEHKKCKKLTIEWPKNLSHLKVLGTKAYCLVEGEWEENKVS